MRVYIISDNIDYGIAASNMLSGGGSSVIISELRSNDVKDLLTDLKGSAGSYDMTVMICTNARDNAISANKLPGVRAVVCKDYEDASEAVANTRANVVVVDSTKLTKKALSDIASGLLEQQAPAPAATPARARAKAPTQPAPMPPQQMQGHGSLLSSIKQDISKGVSSIRKPSVPQASQGQAGSGLLSDIKKKGAKKAIQDALGLGDDQGQ